MRALVCLTLLLGGIFLMGAGDSAGQDKKEKKVPNPNQDESYTEKVSVRRFENGRLLKNAAVNVPAFRYEKGGELKFYTKAKPAATPTKGSEITDEKGAVFVVEKVVEKPGAGYHVSTAKAKP